MNIPRYHKSAQSSFLKLASRAWAIGCADHCLDCAGSRSRHPPSTRGIKLFGAPYVTRDSLNAGPSLGGGAIVLKQEEIKENETEAEPTVQRSAAWFGSTPQCAMDNANNEQRRIRLGRCTECSPFTPKLIKYIHPTLVRIGRIIIQLSSE